MKLRIATFNLENLDVPRKHGVSLDERIAVLRPQLLALRADVLCLQEVNAHDRRDPQRGLRALDRLLEGTSYAGFERTTSLGASGTGPSDKHNLVVLSRLPMLASRQHWHDSVEPPIVRLATTPEPRTEVVRWDRPLLEVRLALPDGRELVVFDVHLRAPLASNIEGQKLAPLVWRSTEGWAEGFFLASLKQMGQALELRRIIDRILDTDPHANVVVAGDLNSDLWSAAVRILCADSEDTGNPSLDARSLVDLAAHVPAERRYTVLHRGRRLVLDHLLVTPPLARGIVSCDMLNEGLADEYDAPLAGITPKGSLHAPFVVELELGG
jgi:endonuclease/exonuclease/phosphatase family metal-dependent hydrolase